MSLSRPEGRGFRSKQGKRMFWIVPNFAAVDAHTQLPPFSTREKFVLATKDSVDYSSRGCRTRKFHRHNMQFGEWPTKITTRRCERIPGCCSRPGSS